jgi:hypothetical protein
MSPLDLGAVELPYPAPGGADEVMIITVLGFLDQTDHRCKRRETPIRVQT